jgi:hypothetical protein
MIGFNSSEGGSHNEMFRSSSVRRDLLDDRHISWRVEYLLLQALTKAASAAEDHGISGNGRSNVRQLRPVRRVEALKEY